MKKQVERFFFPGSGALFGIANEEMLKMKEMSLAYYRTFSNGQNSDLPANLSFVISLDKSMI